MRLDIELCRKILLKIEEEGNHNGLEEFPTIGGVDDNFVFYQIKKMSEAGYIKYDEGGKSFTYKYFSIDATFQGHEFLKQMLDDNIWHKTKEFAKKSGITLTFEAAKAIIPIVIKNMLESLI